MTRYPTPSYVRAAYDHAISTLRSESFPLDGACLEIAVLMHDYIVSRGRRASLIRRRLPGGDGHWTVRVGDVEYDGSIGHASWTDVLPKSDLHVVGPGSPHYRWPADRRVDVRRAYEVAGVRRSW